MAIDVYLQIDGIKGESADDKHKDWIECKSVNWGVLQPKSATASTGGGHTAERCEHKEIAFTKLADLSSPMLLQTCSSGKTIPKAKLEFMRADGQGERIKYFEIELENVLIGSIKPAVEEGDFLTRERGPEVLEGEMEVHPAEGRRRRRRQYLRRLGPGQPTRSA
jgi:type VI secretion system secreted protein Hcp